ncbi:hypothetical protein ND748_16970 [Frankia sp. AiPs1]|uniref:hypothetical protein n=1 Tax=Frankia sp. AiPs1 TaxID=573493 RepID=UPI0020446C98|nr:hypothetical protein [Frankia sp. AiPs1]MCM3923346.1 hypothetical protein [Frankia sp. AiPs1]
MLTVGWILLVICAVAVLASVMLLGQRDSRRAGLQRRFGPEYDRVLAEHADRRSAERQLRQIADRRDAFTINPLTQTDRATYTARWETLQTRFVDDPAEATSLADALVGEVMRARGYPAGSFTERAELLSADHPRVVAGYREAHQRTSAKPDGTGAAGRRDTESLRSAFVRYREVFNQLVGVTAGSGSHAGAGAGDDQTNRQDRPDRPAAGLAATPSQREA